MHSQAVGSYEMTVPMNGVLLVMSDRCDTPVQTQSEQ